MTEAMSAFGVPPAGSFIANPGAYYPGGSSSYQPPHQTPYGGFSAYDYSWQQGTNFSSPPSYTPPVTGGLGSYTPPPFSAAASGLGASAYGSGLGALSSYGGGGCGFGAGAGYAGAGHLDMHYPSAYGGSLGTSAGCPGASSFAASYGAPAASYGAGSYGLGGLSGGMPRTNSFTSYPGASGFGGGGSYVPPVTPGSYVPPAQTSYSAPFSGGAFPTTSSFTAGANYSSLHTGMPTVGSFAAQPQFQFFPETGGAGGLTAPSAGYSSAAGAKGPLTSGAPPKSYMPTGPKAAGPPPVGAKPPPMPASKAPPKAKKGRRGCC